MHHHHHRIAILPHVNTRFVTQTICMYQCLPVLDENKELLLATTEIDLDIPLRPCYNRLLNGSSHRHVNQMRAQFKLVS